MRRALGRLLAAALTLGCAHKAAPPALQGGEGLTPGDRVIARWNDGLYPARVVTVRPGVVTVIWEGPPGASSEVARASVARIEPLSAKSAPGTRAACADRASYVPCAIVAIDAEQAVVRWDETADERTVPRGKVVPLPAGLAGLAAPPPPPRAAAAAENPKPGAASPDPAAAEHAPTRRKVLVPGHSPRRGAKHAKVTIVIFSDFQCPFCARVVPTLTQLEQKYGGQIALVFVNQPLPFHPRARDAARALLAAHRQGKAWEMHDRLFANQQQLAPDDLETHARELRLDVARWKRDLASPGVDKLIDEDQKLADSVGARGTPTFFINGRELVGAQPYAAFAAIVDEEMVKAHALIDQGVRPERLYDQLMEQAAAAPKPARPEPEAPPERVTIEVGDAPVRGARAAAVTIIAFSDFQCPFCSRVVPTVARIEERYQGKVRFAFKHLPLAFHQHAQLAAEAAMAAHEQGQFWAYHDKLFANQRELDREGLERRAQELRLDMTKFRAALDSRRFQQRVEADARLAETIGARGTPTFYINGKKVSGAQPYETFAEAVDAELAELAKKK